MSKPIVGELPHSIEIEILLLSSAFKSIDTVNMICERLLTDDFFLPKHQVMFSLIKSLYLQNKAISLELITDLAKSTGDLTKIGGVDYLLEVNGFNATSYNTEDFVKTLKEKSLLRKIIDFCQNTSILCKNFKGSGLLELIDRLEKSFFQIGKLNDKGLFFEVAAFLRGEYHPEKKAFAQVIQERQEARKRGDSPMRGLPGGYVDIDKKLLGFAPGHFTIIGARPSIGKTTFMANLVLNIAELSKPVGVFSLEMPAAEISEKLVGILSMVNMNDCIDGKLKGNEFQSLYPAVKKLESLSIFVDDQPGITLAQFKSRARRWREVNGIEIIFVDYLQLMRGGARYESKQYEIGAISQEMKCIAKELGIPIVCLAQLNRESEKRNDKRPFLSDLRESGSLEQDCDIALLIHRPDVFDQYTKPGIMEVIIAKNRFGETGVIDLQFDKRTGKINSLFKEEKVPLNPLHLSRYAQD